MEVQSVEVEPDSTLDLAVPASAKTTSATGIAEWRIAGASSGTGGVELRGLDEKGAPLHDLRVVTTDHTIEATLDGARVETEAQGRAFDDLYMLADADVASDSNGKLSVSEHCELAAKELAHSILRYLLVMHTGDVGHAALGLIVGLCFRCFVFDTDCDTHPLPFSDNTCRDARANLLDATPAGIARQIENVREACRCSQTEDPLGSEYDAARTALADDSCNDDACSTVCSGRTGDVEVDRGGFHETCHCGTPNDPCAGVVCGPHQHCSIDTGTCVADPGDLCAGVVCPIGTTCSPLNGMCQPSGGGTVDCEAECTMAGRCGGSIDVWTPTGPTTCSCSATSCGPFEVCDVWGYCAGPGQTCVLDGRCDPDETCACDPACCGPGGGGGDSGQCTWCGGPTISVSQCEACGGTISHFGTMCDEPQVATSCPTN